MPYWQAVLLGAVQGLTEFLPISSTAHLLLVQEWLGRSREQLKEDPFTVVVQLGTLVAVLVYFRCDILTLIQAFYRDLYENRVFSSATPEGRLVKFIIVGTIPVVVIGLLFSKVLKEKFYNPPSIAVVSIVFALLMLASELWTKRQARRGAALRESNQLSWFDAVSIGAWQALSLMPGASRSGTTITAGLFAGLTRATAARFSFLLSLPSVFAAGMKDLAGWLLKVKSDPELATRAGDEAIAMLIGTSIAGIVGYWSIAFLMEFLRKYTMSVFIVYRLILATAILVFVWLGRI